MYLSNSTNITDMAPVYNNSGVPYDDGVFNISFNESVMAQYVHISYGTGRTLSLCEVRVFGGKIYAYIFSLFTKESRV